MTKVRICGQCNKQLTGYNQKKYCSSKCAATYNNKHFVKRKKTYGTCVGCGTQTYPRRTKYCNNCKQQGKHCKYGKHINAYTISEICKRIGSNRYDNIRQHANRIYKDRTHQCEKCSYNKHTEICHVKPIASFPKDTKVGVVNSRENIIFLCPNCHWEYDQELKK
jgi:hypothetical protein